MEEALFDPQTSGGLLLAVDPADAENMLQEMQSAGLPAAIVGKITEKNDFEIYVK
jgi:selenide,water dikinase